MEETLYRGPFGGGSRRRVGLRNVLLPIRGSVRLRPRRTRLTTRNCVVMNQSGSYNNIQNRYDNIKESILINYNVLKYII
jgi:hypothetical protein